MHEPSAEETRHATRKLAIGAGVLLVNLGTPDAPTTSAVRRYLAEFLTDPYVVDIPTLARYSLVYGLILPFRSSRTAALYRKVWTGRGSPLRVHSEDLAAALRARLEVPVALGMRYQRPSIAAAVDELRKAGCDRIIAIPLFPQYSASAWETAAVKIRAIAVEGGLGVTCVEPFHAQPGFLVAQAERIRASLAGFAATDGFVPDKVILSFHGLPERHVRKTDPTAAHCLVAPDCCDVLGTVNRLCYRAQCHATARAIELRLGWNEEVSEVAFQSRLGRTPWIQPFTDVRIRELAREGCRRLAIACPSFVADCLETLEEIGMRAAEDFRVHGGEDLRLIPCINSDPLWVEGLAGIAAAAAE
jgi:ferrochelatase